MRNILRSVPFPLIICSSFIGTSVFSQALQLPSFERFDASTTVMVPDGGAMNTAGVTRSSAGGRTSGTPILPFRNRSYGSSTGISMMQTSVQIIDLHEMDEAILNSPSSPSASTSSSSYYASPLRNGGRTGRNLQPTDRFQERRAAQVSSQAARAGGFLSTREAIQSQIRPQILSNETPKSEGSKSGRSETLNDDLILTQQTMKKQSRSAIRKAK